MSIDINALIAAAQSNANNTLSSAQSAMSYAISYVAGFGNGLAELPSSVITDPELPPGFVPADAPKLTPFALREYAEPGDAPIPTPIINPLEGVGDVPLNTATPIAYVEPLLPSQLGDFSESAPSVNTDFDFPAVPDALSQSIAAPVLADHAAPTAPQVSLPEFSATSPTDMPAVPSDFAAQFTAQYREQSPTMYLALEGRMDAFLSKINPAYQSQLSTLQSKLSQYMAGGTALTDAVQDKIYERARDKNYAEARRARDAAYSDAARRGLTLPSGAVFSAVQQARQAAADNNARANIEIGVKIAEMEQQNAQFAITQTTTLSQITLSALINYHQNLVSINGQALDAAKSVLSALIEVYNAAIKGFSLKLEAYKVEASVYDAKLRAAMAGIELYKAEISALEALTNVDRAKVEIYKGRVEALNSVAAVYKTEVEAIVSKANLEKLKIDLYGAQVQAYAATVNAKTAEYQGYSAAVNGQEAKVRVYSEQIRAYAANVAAWTAKVNGKTEQMRAVAINNQALAETYRSVVAAYTARVEANAKVVSTKIDYGRELIQEYSIANQAAVGAANVRNELYRTQTQVAIERSRLAQTNVLERAKIRLETAKAVSAAATAWGQVSASLASAAMGGMNTLVANTVQE